MASSLRAVACKSGLCLVAARLAEVDALGLVAERRAAADAMRLVAARLGVGCPGAGHWAPGDAGSNRGLRGVLRLIKSVKFSMYGNS